MYVCPISPPLYPRAISGRAFFLGGEVIYLSALDSKPTALHLRPAPCAYGSAYMIGQKQQGGLRLAEVFEMFLRMANAMGGSFLVLFWSHLRPQRVLLNSTWVPT